MVHAVCSLRVELSTVEQATQSYTVHMNAEEHGWYTSAISTALVRHGLAGSECTDDGHPIPDTKSTKPLLSFNIFQYFPPKV